MGTFLAVIVSLALLLAGSWVYDRYRWFRASKTDTIPAYEQYLTIEGQPKASRTDETFTRVAQARQRIAALRAAEDAFWTKLHAGRQPSPRELDDYLKRFPHSTRAGEIRGKAESLWAALQADGKSSDFEGFAERYSTSPRVPEARRKAHDLRWLELQGGVQTAAAYKQFLEKYPDSPHKDRARILASGDQERTGSPNQTWETRRRVENIRQEEPEIISRYESVYTKKPKAKRP